MSGNQIVRLIGNFVFLTGTILLVMLNAPPWALGLVFLSLGNHVMTQAVVREESRP